MIRVTCAIIRNEDQEVLVVQRGQKSDHPFKWEFPGGKTGHGESDEECIIREIREELSIDIVIYDRMKEVDYDYGIKHILLIPFICDTLDELPLLHEHVAFRWMDPADLREIDFSEADLIVAHNYLESLGLKDTLSDNDQSMQCDPAADEDFRQMLTATMHTREVEYIAHSALQDPGVLRMLFACSLSDDRKLASHSSWVLTRVADKSLGIFNDYAPRIIDALGKIANESVQRSFLKIITRVEIGNLSTRHQGLLADHCFSALKSGSTAIAIKAYSMDILFSLALIYPELVHELTETINMLQGEASAGILARGRIILKRLSGLKD